MGAQGHNVDGVRNYQLGRYHDAIQDFQQALVLDPDDADAYYNLGATYFALGKYNSDPTLLSQAEGLYHQCLDIDPDHTECYRGLAALLVDTNRSESAFTLLKRWAGTSYHRADPRIELARLHEEFGDQQAAIQHLTEALHIDSSNARAWAALGRLREQRGELAQALSNYQQAYNLNQFQPGVSHRIASLRQSLNAAPAGSNTQMVNTPSSTIPR
jgi:superkiller protein 3